MDFQFHVKWGEGRLGSGQWYRLQNIEKPLLVFASCTWSSLETMTAKSLLQIIKFVFLNICPFDLPLLIGMPLESLLGVYRLSNHAPP